MLIIDTNIWVSYALTPKGKVGRSLQVALDSCDYAFSDETFREFTEVLLRSKFDAYVSKGKRVNFLKEVARGAQWFQVTEVVSDCRDPKDNMFLALALTCRASFIITGDQDLLVLDPYRTTRIVKIGHSELG